MPRKNLIRTNQHFYHITTRSNQKEWFELPLEEVWDIVQYSLRKALKNNPSRIFQFVLMANHYHMLIHTPNSDIDRFMFWFNKTFSDKLRRASGKENRMFGSSYKWSIISNNRYLENVFKYIYQNPLRASIVDKCEDYPHSTLYYKIKKRNPGFEITPFMFSLERINELLPNKVYEDVKTGLKKTCFKPNSRRRY